MTAAPTLSHLFPAGAQRGSSVDITCHGEFSWPVKVWAPGAEITITEEKGKLAVFVPKDLDTDRIWIRLYNEEGASAAVPFLIGNLPETSEAEPNDAPAAAQKLSEFAPPPGDAEVTINGVLQKNDDVDGFAVELSAGQTLVAAVAANTAFDSPMDAILQVVSPRGTVLAENHDDVGLDPRIAFTAPEKGVYVVRLFAFPAKPDQRIQFRGGKNYVYRLTLTTGPFITHAVPMAVTRKGPHEFEPSTVEVLGWNIPRGTRLPVASLGRSMRNLWAEFEPSGTNVGSSPFGFVRAPGWAGAARVRLVTHRVTPEWAETTELQPLMLPLPNVVSGCIGTPRHADFFRLPLQKGHEILISVESQSLHSPLVPLVRLTDPEGKVAAEVLETGAMKDVFLTHKATHDGDYLLMIRDRFRHGGPQYFYRLNARTKETDFALALDTDALVLTPDKPLEVPVAVQRLATAAETAIKDITIEAIDLADGVTCQTVTSEAKGDSSGKVTLKLETTGQAFCGPIRIRGIAEETKVERFALTPAKFGASFDRVWLTVMGKPSEGK